MYLSLINTNAKGDAMLTGAPEEGSNWRGAKIEGQWHLSIECKIPNLKMIQPEYESPMHTVVTIAVHLCVSAKGHIYDTYCS